MTALTSFITTEAGQIAEAVCDLLNDGTIDLPAVATRHYMPSIELSDPLDSSVLVAATARMQERETRGGLKKHTVGVIPTNKNLSRYVTVEIGVSKKFGSYNDTLSADPIAKTCEQIADLLASVYIDVSTTIQAYAVVDGNTPAVRQDPMYDPVLWKENNQFTGIIKVNYRVIDV